MDTTTVQSVVLGFVFGFIGFFMYSRNQIKFFQSSNYKFVMVVRTDILRTKNKTAVHCCRVALECFKKAKLKYPEIVSSWEKAGQPKVVLKLGKNGNEEMLSLHRKAESLDLVSVAVMLESSYLPNDFSVIGIGPGSEELVNKVTGHLKLL